MKQPLFTLAAALLAPLFLTSLSAAEFTYTGTSGDNDWSTGTDWDSTPVSATETILTYTGTLGDGATVGSNNNVANPFLLNRINFHYEGPGSGTAPVITLTGDTLNFVANGSTNPLIHFNTSTAPEPQYVINNDIQLSDPLTLNFQQATFRTITTTFNGQISGSGQLTLTGDARRSSVTTLTNSANDWSGGLVLRTTGTVDSIRVLQLGANEVIPHGAGKGNVTFNSVGSGAHSAILRLNGFQETINGLQANYDGSIADRDLKHIVENGGAGNSTLTLGDDNTTANFVGRLRDGAGGGTLSIEKIGNGTQTFAGTSTHTGSTTINQGTLEVDYTQFGSSQTNDPSNYFSASSSLTLNGDTTFAIKGRGNGGAVSDEAVTLQRYDNRITVSAATAEALVVGQELVVTREDTSTTTFFVTGIIGNQVYTERRTGLNQSPNSQPAHLNTSATVGTTFQELAGLILSGEADSNATIDFGTTGTVVLQINTAPIQLNDGSTLTIANWAGLISGGGSERLMFLGDPNDFSSVFDQDEVIFDGYGPGYNLIAGIGQYEVTAIPEPAALVLVLVTLGSLFIYGRRRRA